MNLSGSWAGVPVWTIAVVWLLSCAIRGWFKGFWHQLAFPVALSVFLGLRFCLITNLTRVMTGGGLFLSLLAFRGWKWLSSDWPQTNDEPGLLGRQLLGLGGAMVSILTGVGCLWLVLLVADLVGPDIAKEKLGKVIQDVASVIAVGRGD